MTKRSDLIEVGELLESLGRFSEAGCVYKEIAETCFKSLPEAGDVHEYAGLAFKRNDDFSVPKSNMCVPFTWIVRDLVPNGSWMRSRRRIYSLTS